MKLARACIVSAALIFAGACDQLQRAAAPPEFNGASLIIEVDSAAVTVRQLETMSEQMAGVLRDASIRYSGRGVRDGVIRIRMTDPADLPRAMSALAPITGHMTLTEAPDGVIEGRLRDDYVAQVAAQVAQQSIPQLERRLESQRVRVEDYGAGRLIIRSNDDAVPEGVRYVVSHPGLITFHMVCEVTAEEANADPPVPRGAMIVPSFFPGGTAELVYQRPEFTGERLVSAAATTDSVTGQYVVSFRLDAEGRRRFCRITTEHARERFAILIDNEVITAPTINEPICGGTGQVSGNFTAASANELATIMSVGALPAPFRIVEELPPGAP